MQFEAWLNTDRDPLRRRRLLVGYFVGAVSVATVGSFIVLTSPKAKALETDEPAIEAQLAREPEPDSPPEPVSVEHHEAPRPAAPKPKVAPPVRIPTEPLKEAAANKSALADDGDPFQRDKAAEVKPAESAVVPPPPAPVTPKLETRAARKTPIRVTEEVAPPVPFGTNPKPEYPADAKAQGIEGTVLVKYVVSETGEVTEAKLLKGPPVLAAACLSAVRAWRFQPAQLEGHPVAVVRVARFPFKIKT